MTVRVVRLNSAFAPLVPTTNSTFRNVIINGDMRINQRGASNSGYATGNYDVYDRWYAHTINTTGGLTFNIPSTDVPLDQSFTNSLKMTRSDFGGTPFGTTSSISIGQRIEGYYSAQLGYGSSSNIHTLSFWVKSSLAGIYCVSFRNKLLNRSYVSEYTINQANTWEKKTITLPSDASGTWEKTNELGIELNFALASGSNNNNTNTPNTWINGSSIATPNQVNWFTTVGNTFFITGVQLEAGSIATPFEHRPYALELQLCQRYYAVLINPSGTGVGSGYAPGVGAPQINKCTFNFPVELRVKPVTVDVDLDDGFVTDNGQTVSITTARGNYVSSKYDINIDLYANATYPVGQAVKVYSNAGDGVTSGLRLTANVEL
jgi:hypothetical protein